MCGHRGERIDEFSSVPHVEELECPSEDYRDNNHKSFESGKTDVVVNVHEAQHQNKSHQHSLTHEGQMSIGTCVVVIEFVDTSSFVQLGQNKRNGDPDDAGNAATGPAQNCVCPLANWWLQ